jgi:hypothetical protein
MPGAYKFRLTEDWGDGSVYSGKIVADGCLKTEGDDRQHGDYLRWHEHLNDIRALSFALPSFNLVPTADPESAGQSSGDRGKHQGSWCLRGRRGRGGETEVDEGTGEVTSASKVLCYGWEVMSWYGEVKEA